MECVSPTFCRDRNLLLGPTSDYYPSSLSTTSIMSNRDHNHASSRIPNLCGTILNGTDILLLKCIGKGSWGILYLANRINSTNVQYAVKVTDKKLYRPNFDHGLEGQLHQRASKASSHVVKFIQSLEDEETGYHYLITDYCPGGDLRCRIEAESSRLGPGNIIRTQRLRGNDVLMKRLLIQVLDAIAACHAKGIYHRDLKPDNIFIRDDGHVFLGDFGFATTQEWSTSFGTGSEPYMSPGTFLFRLCSSCQQRLTVNEPFRMSQRIPKLVALFTQAV